MQTTGERRIRTVGSHMTCVQCEYDLHGQPTTGNCPECGKPVAESVAEHKRRARGDPPLNRCDVRWLCHMARGVSHIFIAAGFAIAAGWVGTVWRWEHFSFGVFAIPPWVIAASGVWRLTAPEPEKPFKPRRVSRWTLRLVTVFFVGLPVFMIHPGYCDLFGFTISGTWCPYYREALEVGILAPLASALLLWRCAYLAGKGRAEWMKYQFFLLILVWTPLLLYSGNKAYEYVRGWFYSPLVYIYDVGGAAGVGHAGILAPELNRGSWRPLLIADGLLSCYALLLLGCLRVTLLKACIRPPAEPASTEKPQVLGGIG
jgi:hypothetical protein